jgi:hypothetical protein
MIRRLFVLLLGWSGIFLSTLQAQTFFDGEFPEGQWESIPIQWRSISTNRSGTWSAQQAVTGGNPGAFQQFTVDSSTNHLFVANLRKDAIWSPAISGAVLAIHFGLDTRQVASGVPGISFTAALLQDKVFYVGNSSYLPAHLQWAPRTRDWLVFGGDASTWMRADGQEGHPDFSATGQPIQCGYIAIFIAGSPDATHVVSGVDNWTVYVEPAPGPSLAVTPIQGNRIQLAWPTNSFGYGLFAAPALLASPSNWAAMTNAVSISGGKYSVTLPAGSNQQFFQLRKVCWVAGWCL